MFLYVSFDIARSNIYVHKIYIAYIFNIKIKSSEGEVKKEVFNN